MNDYRCCRHCRASEPHHVHTAPCKFTVCGGSTPAEPAAPEHETEEKT